MKEIKGVIYIMTNPSFPEFVKIGYSDDVKKRLKQLNSSEAVPYAFRLYAYYEVEERLADFLVHHLIDSINEELRTSEIYNGRKRVREFYALEPERAFTILEAIAEIKGDRLEHLHKVKETAQDKAEADEMRKIEEIHKKNRAKLPRLKWMLAQGIIKIGDEIYISGYQNSEAIISGDNEINYNGEKLSLNQYASRVTGIKSICAYDYVRTAKSNLTLSEIRSDRLAEINKESKRS